MTAPLPRGPQGLLLDLDGTLYEAEAAVPGAAAAVESLRSAGFPLRFVTNTTRRPRRAVLEALRRFGIGASLEELFTAPSAAGGWLRGRGIRRVALCLPGAAYEDFGDFEIDEERPEAVVVGDLGREWDFDRLNRAFRWILGGAELVAIQRNRYWKTADGLTLDAGPFVAALEYATGKTAHLVGKPSPAFFDAAARSLRLQAAEVAMVGDDLEGDVAGAQAAGALGILVRTGKFRSVELEESPVRPDLVVDSVAALPGLLGRPAAAP